MDARLIPVNAFIAMVSPRVTSWPNPLYEIGYRLEGLEVPVTAGDGRVVIDCVTFDPEANRFVVAEGKSGNNIEAEQARRYGSVDPKDLIRLIGVTITRTGEQGVEALYICLEEGLDRILLGLRAAECDYPVIAVGSDSISLHGAPPADARIGEVFSVAIPVPGPPPGVVLVDDQSDDEEFDSLVSAAIVAEVAQGRDLLPCPDLLRGPSDICTSSEPGIGIGW